MRIQARFVRVTALASLLGATSLVLAGCPKHEDFPQPLNVATVPTPNNFVITQPDTNVFDYDFTWEIDDPAGVVDHYRLYLVGSVAGADELLGETTNTSFLTSFPFSISGLRFGVSAVSTQNVEGGLAAKTVP
jgi:hypothetical protein